MYKRAPLFALLLVQLIDCLKTDAQSVIEQNFAEYQRQALTEKLFVHTDKETYLTGETIWLSIYDVDGMFHNLLDVSKVAYVEILDQDNRPILQTKIQLKNGRGSGSLNVPDILSAKNTLRAYTRWMRNFGPDYFFEKELIIINSVRPNAVRSSEAGDQDNNTIRFFPEGGQLVETITSRVAFQATGHDGKGIDIRGFIKNEIGDTVAQFKTLKFGIGSFLFTPMPGGRYEAVVFYDGKSSLHPFLSVNKNGYALSVNTLSTGKIQAVISRIGVESAENVTLFIHARNKIKLVQATQLKENKGGFLIDGDKLDEGISHFTVFNSAGYPVCERLYFRRPELQLNPEVTLEKKSFGRREKVTMSIVSKTTDNLPVDASLSVSVYNLDSTQFTSPMSILHYLMLSSDLKGRIESPEYYFSSDDNTVNEATDNLMLTHGWRRFKWTDILDHKPMPLPFSPEYEGMIISGAMFHGDSKNAAASQNLFLSFPGTHPQFFTAQTGSNGRFEFLAKNPIGRREALIQSARNPDLYNVSLDPPFSEEYPSRKTPSLVLPDNLKNTFLFNAIHSQAKDYFKKDMNNIVRVSTDSVLFYGTPDKSYRLDDYQRFPTMEDVIREYVREVMVKAKGKRTSLFVLNRAKDEYFEDDPLVMIDGTPITSTHRVVVMAAVGVASLDVVTQRYRLGPATFDGIVSLKTAKGQLAGLQPEPGAFVFDFEGLQSLREFYSPVYPTSAEETDRIPDFRSVLFWQPNLETSKTGDHHINFYTSDETGLFMVVVQGVAKGGIAGCSTFTFNISAH
ncbi:MAG TPA: hypothetical protein VK589_22440 [Chryseolinea sp.]|nr:hypothetical protein [Chryseolinea sp.]